MNSLSFFDRYRIGMLPLKNRIVIAPMTRTCVLQPGNIPPALMAEYYRRHVSAGLIATEVTQISPEGQGYSQTPGLYSAEQTVGW